MLAVCQTSSFAKKIMQTDLHSMAEQVFDEDTLIEFISALANDREEEVAKDELSPSSPYGSGANGWENGTIEAFLGASSAWAAGSKNGMPLYNPASNPWTRIAQILYMGKVYE